MVSQKDGNRKTNISEKKTAKEQRYKPSSLSWLKLPENAISHLSISLLISYFRTSHIDLTMSWFLRSTLLFLALFATAEASQVSTHARDQQIQDVIDWVRSEGGYVNDKIEVRRVDPFDPTSSYGMFAKETIQLNEQIMAIESSSTIKYESSAFDDEENFFEALGGLTKILLKELNLGAKSKYAVYINYLLGQDYGQRATWSEAGKNLLREIFDEGHSDGSLLTDRMEDCFRGKGIQKDDPFDIQSLAIVGERGFNSLLIPLYDTAKHSNDKEAINTEKTLIDLEVVRVWATKEIRAGQEIFTTYNHCTDCDPIVPEDWGTPEMLLYYGYVEPYPRQFRLGIDEDILFSVRETNQTDELEVTWVTKGFVSPDAQDLGWMRHYLKKLQDLLYGGNLYANRNKMTKKEWDVIFEYLQALLLAVNSAIERTLQDTKTAAQVRYTDLDKPIGASDDDYFFIYQCETLTHGIKHFTPIGRSESHYQSLDYCMEPNTKEVCFHIDDVFQMCSSYRPHYHEMGVQLPARYLVESPKRILWIGGGDAMFLHEILKYPDLELAVGLELDQKVTRGAFQYFGVQPHFDNEKVQWWFGDASKSLLMLPQEYFGSFDLVLVDLSDTVLSLSVTTEMDIVGALSLLLKPDGIFSMNELVRRAIVLFLGDHSPNSLLRPSPLLLLLQFFKRVSQVFEHTVQIKYENVPKVCDQAFVFASNDINFLSRSLTGHKVENNRYIEPLSPVYNRFNLVHDYSRNHDSDYKKLCKKSEKDDGEVIQQEGSPGIFMAIEVEEVTMDLWSTKGVQDAVAKALEHEGFKVDSILERTASSGYSRSASDEIVLALREGYVAIRTWAEHKYCAFDIHLWSSFEKHEAAKKAVVASLGGKMETTSSYRIVAGGMFGVMTWKDDAKVHGPQLDKLCDRSEAPRRDAPIDPNAVEIALEAGLRLGLDEGPIVAAVVCGDSEAACATIDILKKNDKVGQVVVLMCPELTPDDELVQDGSEIAIACEDGILKTLTESLTGEKLLGAIVVDSGASRLIGKIVLRMLANSKSRRSMQVLAPNILAIATIDNEETESWKRNFLNLIRLDIVKLDPVFRAEVLFNTTNHSMELGVTSSGDEQFIHRLVDIVADVEKQNDGLSVEIRRFNGGLWRADEKPIMNDADADQVFSHESYDRVAQMEQWNSQQPLAHQSLFQFETTPLEMGDRVHVILKEGDGMMSSEGVIREVNDDKTYIVKFIDDKNDGNNISFDVVHRNDIRQLLFGSPNDGMILTTSRVKVALENALSRMPPSMMIPQAQAQVKVQELPSAGDGSVLAAFWPGGSIIFMWDGRIHFDMNIFTFFESKNLPEALALNLKQEIPGLVTILRDEQPRGYGRVVNFQKDMKIGTTDRKIPFWA